jgi:hypothetical protein
MEEDTGPHNAENAAIQTLTKSGYQTITVIFLTLVFALSIANAIFYFRIYNQSKDRDSGTTIEGLSVTGSLMIGVISILIAIIAIGWALYLLSKAYDLRSKLENWATEKRTNIANAFRRKMDKMFFNQACEASGVSSETASAIERTLSQMSALPAQQGTYRNPNQMSTQQGTYRNPTYMQSTPPLNNPFF